MGRIY